MFQTQWGIALAMGLLAASAASAQNNVVPAPCSDSPTGGLKSCKEYLLEGTPANAAAGIPALPPVAPIGSGNGLIYQRIRETILGNPPTLKGYYQHVDPDPVDPPGKSWGTTICNLVPGPFNNNASEGLNAHTPVGGVKNQLGESCGNPIHLDCVGHSNCGITGCSPTVSTTIQKKWNADPNLSQGTLEDGYGHGGLAAATTCYMQQVLNEIQKSHQVTVMDEGGHPSPCAAMAANGQQMSTSLGNDVSVLKTELTSSQNIAEVANCGSSGKDGGPLRQSAQQLCAHRLGMESLFIQVAVCEIYARAQYSYQKQIGSSAGQQNVNNMLVNAISTPCADQCKNQLNPSVTNQPSDSDITNCANSCYIQKLPGAFMDYQKKLWPGDGSGSCDPLTQNGRQQTRGNPGGPGLLWIGMLAAGRRRKRTRSTSRARSMSSKLFLFGFATLVEAIGSLGCGGGGTYDPPPICTDHGCNSKCDSAPAETVECKCKDPVPPGQKTPAGCDTAPGTGPTKGALWSGFNAAGGATNAHGAVVADQSHADVAKSGAGQGPIAQEVKASAGGLIPDSGTKVATGTGGAGSDSGSGPAAGGARTGAATGGGGGGLGAGFGSLKTGAAGEEGGTLGAAATADPNANGGLYKNGNSAAAGAAPADGMGAFGHGLGGSGDGGTGTSTDSFNADMNGTNGVASTSEDPADYFTRLGLGDNLFKVVERRYRQKSTKWVTDDITQPEVKKPGAPK